MSAAVAKVHREPQAIRTMEGRHDQLESSFRHLVADQVLRDSDETQVGGGGAARAPRDRRGVAH